jgi:hypothetical protein
VTRRASSRSLDLQDLKEVEVLKRNKGSRSSGRPEIGGRSYEGKPYTIPNLEFYECPDCGEHIYDRVAMRKIEAHSPAYAKSRAQKKSA